jgi:hypothetical protein
VATEDDFDLVEPHAASLTESLRAFGYELPTAIADLVDNSITAGARQVWIDFDWDGARSTIVITDDGIGMTAAGLVAAMRPGSQNPLAARDPKDLGRFGLGLKTASFSQCRSVTVRSRTRDGGSVTRCWDLDHIARVNAWQLLRSADAAIEPRMERLERLPCGTAVLWRNLDRLVAGTSPDNAGQQEHFLRRAEAVKEHLGMVFHQLMGGRAGLRLYINNRLVPPWDPFLEHEPATQVLPSTLLKIGESGILIEPFVLPHQSKITKQEHEQAGGPRGWNAHQGFYVYRNRRLLVPGDWLGLGWAKEEHYKLARIRVEFPNSLDQDWQIDVTKSRAIPPRALRDDLRAIGERTRSEAKRVYSHRGAKLTLQADSARVLLWEPLAKHDKTYYRLNRDHPLITRVIEEAGDKRALNALLRLVEETVPFPHITISNSERPGSLPGPFDHSPESQIRDVMREAFRSLVSSGYAPPEAINRLRTIWPFELFPALLGSLAEEAAGV